MAKAQTHRAIYNFNRNERNLEHFAHFVELGPGGMARLVKGWLPVRKIISSNPYQVKLMTYTIESCRYLVWCSALLGIRMGQRLVSSVRG